MRSRSNFTTKSKLRKPQWREIYTYQSRLPTKLNKICANALKHLRLWITNNENIEVALYQTWYSDHKCVS